MLVFVIVGGQPTAADDDDGDSQLANVVASLVARVAKLEAEQSARTSTCKLHWLTTYTYVKIRLFAKFYHLFCTPFSPCQGTG